MSAVSWGSFRLENLLGANDPYTLTPLQAGEHAVYCTNCRLGFHLSTVEFLRRENGGMCSSCNAVGRWQPVILPGGEGLPPVVDLPVVMPGSDEHVVRLDKIWDHVGQFVTFEGYVHQVHQSRSSGTWFVKFEQTRSPIEGFRLVIYNGYTRHWNDAGLNIHDYAGQTIRVRGLIRDDPNWGIQMLIDQPGVIAIVDKPESSEPRPEPPTQRIIWKTE